MQVIGAGLPRTGTMSLKVALERLLGEPCYHMTELFSHLDHAKVWRDALDGKLPDWRSFLSGYAAGVDWPLARFWRQLSASFPDAIVLLSHRQDAEHWYASMDRTVLGRMRAGRANRAELEAGGPSSWGSATPEQLDDLSGMFQRIGGKPFADPDDRAAIMAFYDRHLAEVRAAVPAHRLVQWQPGDGWEPLCSALQVAVPEEPFPHENTTADFLGRTGGDNADVQ